MSTGTNDTSILENIHGFGASFERNRNYGDRTTTWGWLEAKRIKTQSSNAVSCSVGKLS